jgi:hypothetical protein
MHCNSTDSLLPESSDPSSVTWTDVATYRHFPTDFLKFPTTGTDRLMTNNFCHNSQSSALNHDAGQERNPKEKK